LLVAGARTRSKRDDDAAQRKSLWTDQLLGNVSVPIAG
jgi:hypothetical protein